MKKLLLIMLLTFTTFANADEGRYTMVNKPEGSSAVWILDSAQGVLKYCVREWINNNVEIDCSKWKVLYDED
ncbi:uncharacterized protein METZ01_LOCUS244513 [marine metagenome]|uniref:Uncharacterized protein n=1 Tax=marine metagenome TaxID=408172 RepID=A0A382HWX6_9ZZZZ